MLASKVGSNQVVRNLFAFNGFELDFENILMLTMGQTRLLEVHEEKKVWQQREWQEYKVVHGLHSIVYNGQLAQRLE